MCVLKSSGSTRLRRPRRRFSISVWRHGSNSTRGTSTDSAWTKPSYSGKPHMDWERLLQQPSFELRRSGRFLVADLFGPHQVLSTSVRHGGQVDQVRHLLNHQSCEGAAHLDRHRVMIEDGLDAYHDRVCAEVALPPDQTAVMGTAANMNYVAVVTEVDEALTVTAAVTAGVEGNATTAGEPATWRENETGMQKVP